MSNQIQQYGNNPGGHDWGKVIMMIAMAYAIMPDLVPGPLDDLGGIVLGLVVVGLMSLFGGGQ